MYTMRVRKIGGKFFMLGTAPTFIRTNNLTTAKQVATRDAKSRGLTPITEWTDNPCISHRVFQNERGNMAVVRVEFS